MSNETVMLLSAGIAAGVTLLTFSLTRIFDVFSEKRKEQERFFYEIYRQRIKLYKKILKQISLFFDKTFTPPTRDNIPEIANITAIFIEFLDRGAMVASPSVLNTLKLIGKFVGDGVIVGKSFNFDTNLEPFISFMTEHLKLLRNQIRTETCPALVDEFLFKLTGKGTTHKTS